MPLLSGLLSIGHECTACIAFLLVRVVVRGGVEPPTFRFSGGRSYRLSYLTVLAQFFRVPRDPWSRTERS
jgi:hypothetical protein